MAVGATDTRMVSCLLCRVAQRLCAVPLENVVEAMRVLPIEPFSDMPRFVRGISIIRGAPVPVLDLGGLIGLSDGGFERFVTLRAGGRLVALAVDAVLGIRTVGMESFAELPPLLRHAASDTVARIGTLDAELLLVLHAARLMPDLDGLAGAAGSAR